MVTLFYYQFIQNAFLAGTVVAIVAAVVGYFLIARGLTFAGHALSHIGFAGAAAALVAGVDPLVGMLIFTVAAGAIIGFSGKPLREQDISIGVVLTFMLGLGALFIALYSGYAEQAYSILFGTVLGISRAEVMLIAGCSLVVLVSLVLLYRPLLFSTFDPEVAASRGVPVRFLMIIFLLLTAVAVAVAVPVVGVMLIFTLLVGPAATAMRLTHRPLSAIILAIVLGLGYTWLGIFLAMRGSWPVSFYIAALSFGVYLPVRLLTAEAAKNSK